MSSYNNFVDEWKLSTKAACARVAQPQTQARFFANPAPSSPPVRPRAERSPDSGSPNEKPKKRSRKTEVPKPTSLAKTNRQRTIYVIFVRNNVRRTYFHMTDLSWCTLFRTAYEKVVRTVRNNHFTIRYYNMAYEIMVWSDVWMTLSYDIKVRRTKYWSVPYVLMTSSYDNKIRRTKR